MVYATKDPVDGHPIFLDTDAPDIKVDPQQAAEYAAEVGNRIILASLTELNSYPYKRQGLMGHALNTKREYVYDGSGWVELGAGAVISLTAFSSNWSATPGFSPFMVVRGTTQTIYGALNRGAGGALASMLTIPSGHRPPTAAFLSGNVTDGGAAYALQVISSGIVRVPYGGGSVTGVYPLAGSWETV